MTWMKIKKFQRNMKKLSKKKLKRLIEAKELNMGKIFKKLGSSLMMTCQ